MIYVAVFNSPYFGGGVEQVVAQLVNNFKPNFKKELAIICCDPERDEKFFYKDVPCFNLPVNRSGAWNKLFLRTQLDFSRKLANFIEENLKEGDVVNVHGLEYLYELGLRGSSRSRVKIIVTAHGSLFNQVSEYLVKRLPNKYLLVRVWFFFWRWYYYRLEKIALRAADEMIAINKTISNYFKQIYHYDNPIKVIYNGINGINNKSITKIHKLNRQKFRAIIVGSNTVLKGLDIAVRTVEYYNKTSNTPLYLSIVGFTDFPDMLPQFISNPFINYVGRVSPQNIDRYYEESDFLLMPSRFEGFPLTILESLRSGLPVIVSDICKTNELPSNKNYSIIVRGYKISSWVDAIKKMTLEYESYKAGIGKADLKNFYWSNVANSYAVELTNDK